MHDYLALLAPVIFLGPLMILGFWAKRVSERELKHRKDQDAV